METITEREAAMEILLLMADADAGWGDYGHAVELVDVVAEAAGVLPAEYEIKRSRWQRLQRLAV